MVARGVALGLGMLVVLPFAAAAPEQVHVSQLPGGLAVQWALPGDTRALPNGSVQWGSSAIYGQEVEAEMVGYVDATPFVGYSSANLARDLAEAAATIYRAQLPPMAAATTVHYRVVDGLGVASADFEVATLPGPDQPVRLLVYGDQGTLEDGGIGPPTYRPMEIVNLSVGLDPQLVLVTGDLSYAEEGAIRWWNQWFEIIEPLAATRPFYSAVGNHDRDFVVAYDHWYKRFAFPGDEQNYAFDAGPVHVLVVNSQEACLEGETTQAVQRVNPNCTLTSASGAPLENTEITDFMKADLADAQSRGMPWSVVVFHHPPYANGGYNESNAGASYMWWMRDHWLPILEQYGVDLVFTGHDHDYERSWPMLDNATTTTSGTRFREGDGIVYVVTGGGGRNTYALGTDTPWWLAKGVRAHHATVVDATGTKLKVFAKDHTGATIDAFEIRKTGGGGQNGLPWLLALAAFAGIAGRHVARKRK